MGIEPMTNKSFPSLEFPLREKWRTFHVVLRYLVYEIKVNPYF